MTAPLSTWIDQARQGDAQAIAHLLTRALANQGIVARGQWQGTQLHLDLESEVAIPPDRAVPYIRRGLQRLELTCPVELVWVSGRQTGQESSDWQESFGLGNLFIPAAVEARSIDRESRPSQRSLSQRSPSQRSGTASPGDAPLLPLAEVEPAPPAAYASQAEPQGNRAGEPLPSEADPVYLSEATLVALAHLAPLFSYLIVGTQWLGGWPLFWGGSFLLPWRVVAPLALLLVKGAEPDAVALQQQAKAALNFQLTMLIAWLGTIALMFILVGFLLVVPLALVEIISCIVAAVGAVEGKPARYPAIRFVR